MSDDTTLTETYAILLGAAAGIVTSGTSVLEVAACLSQIGLSLYKDHLSSEDYEAICDEISNRRHLITGFLDTVDAVDGSNRVLH